MTEQKSIAETMAENISANPEPAIALGVLFILFLFILWYESTTWSAWTTRFAFIPKRIGRDRWLWLWFYQECGCWSYVPGMGDMNDAVFRRRIGDTGVGELSGGGDFTWERKGGTLPPDPVDGYSRHHCWPFMNS